MSKTLVEKLVSEMFGVIDPLMISLDDFERIACDVLTARVEAFDKRRSEWLPKVKASKTAREFSDALVGGLDEQQSKAVPVLEWLLSGGRATGRSHALAVCLIRRAIRSPGTRVFLFDHFGGSLDRHLMLKNIREIVSANSEISKSFLFSEHDTSIVFKSDSAVSVGDPAQRL